MSEIEQTLSAAAHRLPTHASGSAAKVRIPTKNRPIDIPNDSTLAIVLLPEPKNPCVTGYQHRACQPQKAAENQRFQV
jgi:hypothetical protein